MSNISKSLLLLVLFVGLCGVFVSCSALRTPELTREDSLRKTLSVLETKAASLQKTSVPAENNSSVPDTGGNFTSTPDTPAPLVEAQPSEPAPLESTEMNQTEVLEPTLTPTLVCERDDSRMTLTTPKTKLKVGETVAVKVVLKNTGCVPLGLPQYRLAILNSEGKPIFSPDKPEPVIHSLAVTQGNTDETTFLLRAVSPGKATLSAMASFEVHLGYLGSAYWGANSSEAVVIEVEK
jgi:hypothetical protein